MANQNSGYGRALLDGIRAVVPAFGRIFIVVDPDDTDEKHYQVLQDLFPPDENGAVRFFTSLADANAATQNNNHDVIVMDGDSTHVLTSMLTVSNSRVHFVGLDYLMGIHRRYGQSTKVQLGVTTAATDIGTIKVTGVRCSFRGIKFVNANTVAEGIYCFVDGGEYTYVEDCEIYKETDLDVTGAAELVCNGDSSLYVHCYIGSTVNAISGAIIRPCVTFSRGLAGSGKVARDVEFVDCVFARKCGDTANRFVYGAEANAVERRAAFKKCEFWNAKLAAAVPAQNVAFGSSLTDGEVLLEDCTAMNAATAMSTTTGVFVQGAVPTGATSGIAVQAS